MASLEQQIQDFAADLRSSLSQSSAGTNNPAAFGQAVDTFVLNPIRREFTAVADHLDQNVSVMLQSLQEKAIQVAQEQEEFQKRVVSMLDRAKENQKRQQEIVNVVREKLATRNEGVKMDPDLLPRADKIVADIQEYRETLKSIQRTNYKAYINSSERRGNEGLLIELVNQTPFPYDKLELVLEGEGEAPITTSIGGKVLLPSATLFLPMTAIGKVTPGKRYTMTVYSNSKPLSQATDLPD